MSTHETFITAVRDLALARIPDGEERAKLTAAKMVYGVGSMSGARGVTYYAAWSINGGPQEFIEIAASGEESHIQLAGTTIHELGHVLAGHTAGHDKDWKAACLRLGLTAEAAGQHYDPAHFDPALWSAIETLPHPADGKPQIGVSGAARPFVGLPVTKPRPCPLGIGTRGGRSRGPGSGSRLRLYVCACNPPIRVRVSSDDFRAHCDRCSSAFNRA